MIITCRDDGNDHDDDDHKLVSGSQIALIFITVMAKAQVSIMAGFYPSQPYMQMCQVWDIKH